MTKNGGVLLLTLVVLLILIVGTGGYFLFFKEKCQENQLFDPYNNICVNKNILCDLNEDCLLLEGQTVTVNSLKFTLVSATEEQGYDKATINVAGLGDVNLMNRDNKGQDFSFDNYTIIFEAADGDSDKIMGAEFTVVSK